MQPNPWSTENTPAGWHADPTKRFEFRYWNGERWTADVSSHGQRFVDPQSMLTTATAVELDRQPGRGHALVAFIVGLSSLAIAWAPFIFVLGAAGAITAFVFGLLALGRIRRGAATGRNLALWGMVASVAAAGLCVAGAFFTIAVMHRINNYFDPGPYETHIDSCTTESGLVTLDATIRNTDTITHDYTVFVRYTNGGKLLETDSVTVRGVAPSAKGAIHATTFVDTSIRQATCAIEDVEGLNP